MNASWCIKWFFQSFLRGLLGGATKSWSRLRVRNYFERPSGNWPIVPHNRGRSERNWDGGGGGSIEKPWKNIIYHLNLVLEIMKQRIMATNLPYTTEYIFFFTPKWLVADVLAKGTEVIVNVCGRQFLMRGLGGGVASHRTPSALSHTATPLPLPPLPPLPPPLFWFLMPLSVPFTYCPLSPIVPFSNTVLCHLFP